MSLIIGFGDIKIRDISYLPDPCPLPEVLKKRALIEKEKLIYAPFSGVGGIIYDKDAVYVEMGGSHSYKERIEDNEENNFVAKLTDVTELLNLGSKNVGFQLFSHSKPASHSNEVESDNQSDSSNQISSEDECESGTEEYKLKQNATAKRKEIDTNENPNMLKNVVSTSRRKLVDDKDDSTSEEEDDEELKLYNKKMTENQCSDVCIKVADTLKALEQHTSIVGNKSLVPKSKNLELADSDEDESDLSDGSDGESSMYDGSDSLVDDDDGVKWKDNIAKKAEKAFESRLQSKKNLMTLVYGKYISFISDQ